MGKSPLCTEGYPAYSGNYTTGRQKKIRCITIHHVAGKLTARQCGAIFQTVGRRGSSHYGIGYNGEIAWYVDENDTAWTNSNWDSNCESITIETANDENGGNWHVSEASINSLIRLVADIAKRNNLGTLVKGQNVTWHSMFANTNCPGPYLMSQFDRIIAEANRINQGGSPTPAPSGKYKVGDKVKINGVYVSSTSTEKLNPARTEGTITSIKAGARNPYLLDNGNLGWVNDGCIVSSPAPAPTGKYLNLSPTVSSWTVYKTNNYYIPSRTSDVAGKLNPQRFGGLTYRILQDMGNYHFKIHTSNFGDVYIAGNPNKYACTITNSPVYGIGSY